jgi:protein-S-isoprenylcysteine O-methyltransferase Ste14
MSFSNVRRRFDQSHFYDCAMRTPIIAYSLFVLARDTLSLLGQIQASPEAFEQPDSGVVIAMLARISQWIFVALLAILPVFRLRPIAKSDRILARLVALLAVCILPMFMLLERAPPNLIFNSVAVVLSVTANVMAVITVSFLGRSLSVMPEARQMIQRGPYAVVRHPLYLCEILGVAAVVLQYRSFAALMLLLLIVMLQLARACWEEAVLASVFPGFAGYRLRTSFLIPRDPARFLVMFFTDPFSRRRLVLVVSATLGLSALVLSILPEMFRS